MKVLVGVLLLALVIASASACGGDGPATPPTAAPEPQIVGPILVYTKQTPFEESVRQVGTLLTAYDVGGARTIHESPIGQSEPILDTAMGEVIYVGRSADGTEIRAVNFSTGNERVVYRPQHPLAFGLALSPDGSSLALSELESLDPASNTFVLVVDVASGAARTIATSADQSDAFRGRPTPRVWRDDGRGILASGITASGASGWWATIMLDGAVTTHLRDFAFPSPNGRILALDDVNGVGCILADVQRLRLFDVDANAEVARVEDVGRGLLESGEWSPDGDSLLFQQFATSLDPQNDCLPRYDAASARWFVLKASGGPPEPVADVAALRAKWRPAARIDLNCVSGPADVFGSCPGRDVRTLLVNGAEIDRGDSIRVLGFIHPSN